MSKEWNTHRGSDCPVPPDTRIQIRLRNGREPDPSPAHHWRWRSWPEGPSDFDIVEWRMVT